MQIIKGKERIGNILFTAGLVLELIIMLAGHCSWITLPYSGRVAQVAFVLFGCKILTTRYSIREWGIIAVMGILGVISYVTSHDEYVVRAVVMVIAAKDIDEIFNVKIVFYASAVASLLIIILAALGIQGQVMDVRDYGRGGIEARWCLGFNHANNLHCVYWYLTALLLYVRKGILKWWGYVLILTANVMLFVLTASKTGLIATTLLIAAVAVCQWKKEIANRWWPYILGIVSVIACVAMTILGATYGNANGASRFLDRFLNQRLNMCHDIAYIGDWTFFPGPRELRKIVDNGMASFAYIYGIVFFVILVAVIIYMMIRAHSEKNVMLLMLTVTFTYVWFMESTFAMNTSLLCTLLYIILFNRWYKSELIQQEE